MAKACLGAFLYVGKGNGLGKQYKLTCLTRFAVVPWFLTVLLKHHLEVAFKYAVEQDEAAS